MCSTDFDPADIFNVVARKARVVHRCDECACRIWPGESYARATWLADGHWSDSIRCAQCYFLAETVETLLCGGHGMILWGGQCLREEMDYLGNEPEFQWAHDLWAHVRYRALETYS